MANSEQDMGFVPPTRNQSPTYLMPPDIPELKWTTCCPRCLEPTHEGDATRVVLLLAMQWQANVEGYAHIQLLKHATSMLSMADSRCRPVPRKSIEDNDVEQSHGAATDAAALPG